MGVRGPAGYPAGPLPCGRIGLVSAHPVAPVPDRLFDDEREQRWRARYTAPRMSRPAWARDAPDRCLYTSNASGTTEVYVWDRATDLHRRVTDRPSGTYAATLTPDGAAVWWFADTDGDEFGHWVTEPFAGGAPEPALPDVEDGYPAGLDVGRAVVAAGTSTDAGTRIWVRRGDPPAAVIYENAEDATVGGLSEDETLLAIGHAEHGDSRHPDVRVVRVADGSTVAEKSDGPGKGLTPLVFAPVAGRPAPAAHARAPRPRGAADLGRRRRHRDPRSSSTCRARSPPTSSPDATFLLVWHTHAARTRLYRYDLDSGALTELPVAPGCVGSAAGPPGRHGRVHLFVGRGAHQRARAARRRHRPRARGAARRTGAGLGAPSRTCGPGIVHALVARAGEGPRPTVFSLHGGPHAADEDRFSPARATWVDAGFTVVEVNYRGSTGYGSAWRDAIEGRPGLHRAGGRRRGVRPLRRRGHRRPGALRRRGLVVGRLPGAAGGGHPAAAVGGGHRGRAGGRLPHRLRRRDGAAAGVRPGAVRRARRRSGPTRYRAASPLTYVDAVRAPVLVLAGENDPRCPIRQIDNYLDALAARGADYAVSRFDAGHGSLVVEQSMAHMATEVHFVRGALGREWIRSL